MEERTLLYKKEVWYNNNAVFAGIMIIYGPRFFIYGLPVLFMWFSCTSWTTMLISISKAQQYGGERTLLYKKKV